MTHHVCDSGLYSFFFIIIISHPEPFETRTVLLVRSRPGSGGVAAAPAPHKPPRQHKRQVSLFRRLAELSVQGLLGGCSFFPSFFFFFFVAATKVVQLSVIAVGCVYSPTRTSIMITSPPLDV